MEKKILTKIKLINWHYFENETIEVQNSVLFCGDSGTGKSTILDAMQYVLTGGGKNFNKAANEKSKRDLKGYVRCKTGDMEKTYKRNGMIVSYIALEFYEERKKSHFVIGVRLESPNEEDSVKRYWFVEECKINDIVFLEENKAVSLSEFTAKGRKINTKKSDEEGRTRILQRLGNLDYRFLDLIPRSLAFKPENDIKSFFYQILLSEMKIDVDRLKQDLHSVKEMDDLIKTTKEEISALKIILDTYHEYELKGKEILVIEILLLLADYYRSQEELEKQQSKLSRITTLINSTNKELEEQNLKIRELENQRSQILAALATTDAQKLVESLTVNLHAAERKEIQLKVEADKFNTCRLTIQKLFAQLNINNSWFDELDCKKNKDEKLIIIEEIKRKLKELREQNHNDEIDIQRQLKDNEAILQKLNIQIERLKQNKFDYPYNLTKVKSEIEKVFHKRNIDDRVIIICEELEITDPSWKDAIESYLNTQKFYLIVKPENFEIAFKAYKSLGKNISGIGLVDTTKFKSDFSVSENSLACYINSNNPYVKRYAQYLLTKVYACDTPHNLTEHKIAITRDCMLYKNFVVKRQERASYDPPYIGRDAIQVQLSQRLEEQKQRREKQKDIEEQFKNISLIRNLFDKISINDLIDYFNSNDELKICRSEIGKLKAEIEKAKSDKSLLLFQERLSKVEHRLDEQKEYLNKLQLQLAEYKQECKSIKEKIDTEQINLNNLDNTIKDKRQQNDDCYLKAKNKYEGAEKKNNSTTIYSNYTPRKNTLLNEQDRIKLSLINLQSKYNQIYNNDFPIGIEEFIILQYCERLNILEKSKLVEYEGKLIIRREECEEEFKTSFLAKMKENIELAQMDFKELNKKLALIDYNGTKYQFKISACRDKKALYNMITDDKNIGGYTLFTQSFESSYQTEINDLFGKLMADEDSKVLNEYTDYRNYMDYDIEVCEGDRKFFLSKNVAEKSGGETQVPYYVIIAASFNQIYSNDTIKLIMLDEAFDKMDEIRMQSMMEFFAKLDFQMILATPPGKMSVIGDQVNSIFLTIRDADRSTIEQYYL